MSAALTASPPPTPRLRIFRIWPERTRPAGILTALVVAYLALIPAGLYYGVYWSITIVRGARIDAMPSRAAGWAAVIAMSSLLGLPFVVPWLVHAFVPPRRKLRMKRLLRLAEDSRTLTRLPHRIAEYLLTANPYSRRFARVAMFAIKPGQALVIDGPRLSHAFSEASLMREFFEPVELGDLDRELRREAISSTLRSSRQFKAASRPPADRPRWLNREAGAFNFAAIGSLVTLYWIVLLGGAFLIVGLALRTVYRISVQRATGIEMALGAGSILIALIGTVWLIGHDDALFAVPGGLVWRRARRWGGDTEIELWSSESAALIADLDRDQFTIIAGGRWLAHPYYARAALAAWISRARHPTRSEIEAYFQADRPG